VHLGKRPGKKAKLRAANELLGFSQFGFAFCAPSMVQLWLKPLVVAGRSRPIDPICDLIQKFLPYRFSPTFTSRFGFSFPLDTWLLVTLAALDFRKDTLSLYLLFEALQRCFDAFAFANSNL
jgi:hypothetical protein